MWESFSVGTAAAAALAIRGSRCGCLCSPVGSKADFQQHVEPSECIPSHGAGIMFLHARCAPGQSGRTSTSRGAPQPVGAHLNQSGRTSTTKGHFSHLVSASAGTGYQARARVAASGSTPPDIPAVAKINCASRLSSGTQQKIGESQSQMYRKRPTKGMPVLTAARRRGTKKKYAFVCGHTPCKTTGQPILQPIALEASNPMSRQTLGTLAVLEPSHASIVRAMTVGCALGVQFGAADAADVDGA
eukprot:357076-Chlamydomonas_euryale.AAC.7